ncbi:unnamed protein product [Linum tenue]|uniref:Protein kinase domain-containing protein n=1 Tax=Linum tenue TaxID=586396 RepID=A0AAV0I9D4_9ROSI|nr:unnamed protein product [Linum tenue]
MSSFSFHLADANYRPRTQANNETDRLALLEFRSMISSDPFGVLTSWNDSTHFCQWHGVSCDSNTGHDGRARVTVLDLRHQKLLGPITPHIGSSDDSMFILTCIGSCSLVIWIRKRRKRGSRSFDQNGSTIAVKVFNLDRRGASKSFVAECEALKNIRHRNLVKILTVCSGVDRQGNDFKALVYELLPNGSMEEWLHEVESVDEPPKSLSFRQRMDVDINVASALDYLHHQCETPIVHCDLKPNNILLDEDKGTIGYAPPEYGMGNEVSTQGDVYSFGIILLEMLTGRRPTDENFEEGLNLQTFVQSALSHISFPTEAIDSILLNELLLCQISKEIVIAVLKIGVACTSESPQERPSISQVLARLKKPLT